MPDRPLLRYRRLSAGEFLQAHRGGWNGALLEFDPTVPEAGLSPGDLIEIEDGPVLYLGRFEQWHGSTAVVLVEHRIDRSKLQALEKAWE